MDAFVDALALANRGAGVAIAVWCVISTIVTSVSKGIWSLLNQRASHYLFRISRESRPMSSSNNNNDNKQDQKDQVAHETQTVLRSISAELEEGLAETPASLLPRCITVGAG
jgi:hypothetical protein